jgi:hypothetical protein
MATRAERAEDAIQGAAEWPQLLWALALNRSPVRRSYLAAVTRLAPRPLVKALARLANEGVVAPTEGLVFQLDRKSYGNEITARVPEDEARAIHEQSLHWAREQEHVDPDFMMEHLVGGGLWAEASDGLVARLAPRLEEENGGVTPVEVARAKAILLGLMEHARENRGRILELGMMVVERARSGLKPTELKNLIASLRELDPGEELMSRLDAVEVAAKGEARARRQKKKAESGDREPSLPGVVPAAEAPDSAKADPASV